MMLEFPLERPVFIREYRTAHYGATLYFLSKMLVELPLIFVQSAIVFLVAYPLMSLQGDLLELILIAWVSEC
jgi:ABC-type multidrug transport system permease subunit